MLAAERAELARLAPELLAAEPSTLAVMLHGSHAGGDAGHFSEIDLRVFTAAPPCQRDRERVTEPAGPRADESAPAIGARMLAEKLTEFAEPESWPWAAAHCRDMQPLHDPYDLWRVLRAAVAAARPGPAAYVPPVGHALSELLEYAGKLKNAATAPPDPDVFDADVKLARRCETVLRPLNPVGVFASEIEESACLRTLTVAPARWALNRALRLGMTTVPRSFSAVCAAAQRVAAGAVALRREPAAVLGLPADLDADPCAGALSRYLAHGATLDRTVCPHSETTRRGARA